MISAQNLFALAAVLESALIRLRDEEQQFLLKICEKFDSNYRFYGVSALARQTVRIFEINEPFADISAYKICFVYKKRLFSFCWEAAS